jgi:hypothetical protein
LSAQIGVARYYVITSMLNSGYDGLTKYGRLQDATRAALEISRYAPWIQLYVVEMPVCKIVKLVQDGQEYIAVQTTLFDESLELDEKYAANLGKLWWRRWEQQARQIAALRGKLSPTEDDVDRIDVLQNDLDTYLQTLKPRLHPQSYELCVWKHIESAVNKNRRVELPSNLRHYDKTSINRRIRAGYIDTGYIAYEQGWILVAEPTSSTFSPLKTPKKTR